MPCSPRMARCSLSCQHRVYVEAYQERRAADELRLENETNMLPGDVERWKESNAMITFKAWLEGAR